MENQFSMEIIMRKRIPLRRRGGVFLGIVGEEVAGLGVLVWGPPPRLPPGGAAVRDEWKGAPTGTQPHRSRHSGQPGQDAELSGSLPGSCGRSLGVTARGSASGTARRHRQAPVPALGKQKAGPSTAHPFLYPGHPLTEKRRVQSAVLRETVFVPIHAVPACRTPASSPLALPSRCPAEESCWHHLPPPEHV